MAISLESIKEFFKTELQIVEQYLIVHLEGKNVLIGTVDNMGVLTVTPEGKRIMEVTPEVAPDQPPKSVTVDVSKKK